MEVLRVKIQGAKEELEDCQARLEQLERERTQMPTAEELDQALELLEQSRRALELAQTERERRLSAEQEAKQAWAALDQESRSRSAGLPYERTSAAYEEAREAAAGYRDALGALNSRRQALAYVAAPYKVNRTPLMSSVLRRRTSGGQTARCKTGSVSSRPVFRSCGTFWLVRKIRPGPSGWQSLSAKLSFKKAKTGMRKSSAPAWRSSQKRRRCHPAAKAGSDRRGDR